jgi:hypothetical protein
MESNGDVSDQFSWSDVNAVTSDCSASGGFGLVDDAECVYELRALARGINQGGGHQASLHPYGE